MNVRFAFPNLAIYSEHFVVHRHPPCVSPFPTTFNHALEARANTFIDVPAAATPEFLKVQLHTTHNTTHQTPEI